MTTKWGTNRSIFRANFEQSKKLFSKANILNGGSFANVGMLDVKSRLLVLFTGGWMLAGLIFAGGQGMVGAGARAAAHPDEFHIISVSTIVWIDHASVAIKPILIPYLIIFELLLFLNLLPGKSLPIQILFATIVVDFVLLPMGTIGIFPWAVGLTLSGMGWFGFWLQVIVGGTFVIRSIYKKRRNVSMRMFGDGVSGTDWIAVYDRIYRASWPFMFTFVALNMYVFHIGQSVEGSPTILLALLGWATLIVIMLFGWTFSWSLPQLIANYYFIRYAKQYRKAYKFTDIEWYGRGRVWVNHLFKRTKK